MNLPWTVPAFILGMLVLVVVIFFIFRTASSGKLDIATKPQTVQTYPLNKSIIGVKGQRSKSSEERQLICITEGVESAAIEAAPQTRGGTELVGSGMPSTGYWKGGKWELQLHLSLYNNSQSQILVYDIHSHVYSVSAMQLPLLDLSYSPRIELAQDNSILSQGMRFQLAPCEYQPIDLVLETSLFDTLQTSIVFGLFVDYEIPSLGDVKKCRIPSNDIYVFLHDHHWGMSKCQFAAENPQVITMQAERNKSHKELWSSLRAIHTKHTAERLLVLN